jgi:hypothetical protein
VPGVTSKELQRSPRKQAARCGEKDAIAGVELGASMLTPKDRQLVAHNDDLELLERPASGSAAGPAQNTRRSAR